MIDLDQAGDEEFLLLVGLSLPIVRLSERYEKSHISGPFLVICIGCRACVGLNGAEIVQVPGLSNRKGAVRVLFGLVHPHSARLANGDDDCALLLGGGCSLVWRWGRGRGARIFGDLDMGYVGLEDGTMVVLLAETAVNDASFLIFKELRPGPVSPRWQRHGDQLWSLLLGSTSGRWSEGSFMKFRAARSRRGASASSGETTVCAPQRASVVIGEYGRIAIKDVRSRSEK